MTINRVNTPSLKTHKNVEWRGGRMILNQYRGFRREGGRTHYNNKEKMIFSKGLDMRSGIGKPDRAWSENVFSFKL